MNITTTLAAGSRTRATQQDRKAYKRHGVQNDAFGTSVAGLRQARV